ncbi:hypothetical protein PFUGPA_00822 [Plasmodium falciparum Palo Alto/Uganda]|uniref:Erythrocyte membrane protein 1 n=2 Tax=Plasmodium falciparum TaxID=5833 RepID=W4J600_PLAFP|nr:hypothetical protein PFUGPA_00822 [Plasmodium falciparum Palo Alto/Uganda]
MAPQNGGGGGQGGKDDYKDAKDFLDKIGQQVHDEIVKKDAKTYKEALKGNLTSSTFFDGELAGFSDPCNLIKNESEKLAALGDPCGSAGEKRFSKERVAEYDEKKIRDTNKSKGGNNEGQCAPYRRLSLCNKNFQKINNIDSDKARHNLLVDVCMAAKYEGNSITLNYPKYQTTYDSFPFELCTVLARSFADIGDIIRGRDLYSGNNKEKEQRKKLEKNLKTIFGKIYNEVTNGQALQARYKDDADNNYFQLREDWWTANRGTIWEAITCDDDNKLSNASYFRPTCIDGQSGAQAKDKCRCDKEKAGKANDNVSIVPTYFDYVPQYLRWFEEWTEDFCRKKKKYVDIVKTYCRGDKNEKYCSRNGFDCTKTKRAIGKYRMGNQCTKCLYACNPYVEWINNQKEQFDKQKKKYDEEIKIYTEGAPRSSSRKRRGAPSNINYDGYEKNFYEQLKKSRYGTFDDFLELLNKEKACTAVDDDKGGKIDFKQVNSGGTSGTNDKEKGTFYRSEYCQPCPHCGVKKKSDGKWEAKKEDDKCNINLYKPKPEANGTPINFLYSGDEATEIGKKLKKFCETKNGSDGGAVAGGSGTSGSNELYQKWTCYEFKDLQKDINGVDDEDDDEYDGLVKTGGGLCILKNQKKKEKGKEKESDPEPDEIQKTFNDFFYYWVAHMLKDSIYWKKKLQRCLQNGNKKCGKKICNGDCGCFKKWIEQKKKEEWDPIKQHFYKQPNIPGNCYFITLEWNLKEEFYKEKSEENSKNSLDEEEAEELKRIREIIEKKNQEGAASGGGASGGGASGGGPNCSDSDNEKETIMDKLIDYELQEAEKCKQKQEDCNRQQQEQAARARGRSEDFEQHTPSPASPTGSNEEEEEPEETAEDANEDTTVEDTETPKVDDVNVCETVKSALTGDNLIKACQQKYEKGREKFPNWKCVPTSGDNTTTGEARARRVARSAPESGSNSDKNGAICIPPRRRRLYIKKIVDWATKTEASQKDGTQVEGSSEQSVQSTRNGGTEGSSSGPSTSEGSVQTASHLPNSHPASPSHSRDDAALRDAFIQSAAIETFFLWHRYKKENTKRQSGVGAQLQLPQGAGDDDKDPQKELQESGKIPDDFLRQMFYTLADYKDILFSNTDIVLKALSSSEKEKMKEIQKKIKALFPESANEGVSQPPSGKPVTQTQRSDKRTALWDRIAQPIWNGMVYALTYKTDTPSGQTPEQDPKVKQALWDTEKKQPKEDKYKYDQVKLEDESDTQAKTNEDPTHLSKFVLRPPYFRYLEEWGETFCSERQKRLEEVKDDCKVEEDEYKCDGDGFKCTQTITNEDETIKGFDCSTCARHCRWYKRWIERKKIEFNKQSGAYSEQKEKYEDESNGAGRNNGGIGFCGKLEKDAAEFLKRLKNGPCKNNDDGNNSGENEIDFKKTQETFGHKKYCGTCPEFKINCKNGKCSNGDGTKGKCDGKTPITAEDINGSAEDIGMVVSDNNIKKYDDLKDACEHAGIFEGIRKDVWTCGKVCGLDVCGLKSDNGKKGNGNQIIIIRALFKRWLEYFLEDYNKIKHKISHCTKKGEKTICINDCVEKWINIKKKEWETIKKVYENQYGKEESDSDNHYSVRSFLEDLIPENHLVNGEKKLIKLSQFDKSCGCSAKTNSENNKNEDAIDCMLQKLEKKIGECTSQSSGDTPSTCDENLTPLVEDDEEENEEENDKKVGHPTFCKIEEKKEEEESGCEEAPPKESAEPPSSPTGTSGEETNSEQTPVLKPEEEAPAQQPPAQPLPQHPRQKREFTPSDWWKVMSASAFPLSVGIAFATFTYFFLKMLMYIYV